MKYLNLIARMIISPLRYRLKPISPSLHSRSQTLKLASHLLLLSLSASLLAPQPLLLAKEPIVGKLLRNITSAQLDNTMSTSGQIQIYQILRLELEKPEQFQTIELDITPAPTNPDNNPNGGNPNTVAVSLMAYGQVEMRNQKLPNPSKISPLISFQGNRLLTRGLTSQSYIRFDLNSTPYPAAFAEPIGLPPPRSQGRSSSINPKTQIPPNSYNSLNIPIESQSFPVYIVLYPLQTVANSVDRNITEPNSTTSYPTTEHANYQYRIQYQKKNYGFVRFQLLADPQENLPRPNEKQTEASTLSKLLNENNLHLELKIDGRSYPWNFDPNFQTSQTQEPKNKNQYSQQYIIETGQHNIQVNTMQYYARSQFTASPGASQIVPLLLRERLGQLQLIVPQNAAVLLDGIPLQKKKDWTPSWKNVQVQEVENYNYEQNRLRYQVSLPIGKHHMLIQYEGNTWEREIFCREGEQLSFQLNWDLLYSEPQTQGKTP